MRRGDTTVSNTNLVDPFIVQLKAINRVRVGEEHEIQNLVEYLTNQTVRE